MEFRRCLCTALMDDVSALASIGEDEEDRIMLLAEKNSAGDVRWRPFAQAYAGWHDIDTGSDVGDRLLKLPISPKKPNSQVRDLSSTQQSWRSIKTSQAGTRTVVT